MRMQEETILEREPTKLQRVIALYLYLRKNDLFYRRKSVHDYEKTRKDLGWEDYSIQRIKRLESRIDPHLDIWPGLSYNRELFILLYLDSMYTSAHKKIYVSSEQLIRAMDLVDRITTRSVERYIKEIQEAGYVIKTRRGRYGGYRLFKPFIDKN